MSAHESLTVELPKQKSISIKSKSSVRYEDQIKTCRDPPAEKSKIKSECQYYSFDTTTIQPEYKPKIPFVECKPGEYHPMPYVFRVPVLDVEHNISNQSTRCPPFHVQLDHAIAVIWSLYSPEDVEIPLGINQLQWAYYFLKNIKDDKGKHSPDVMHCLETISDELIAQYSELSNDVDAIKNQTLSPFTPEAQSSKIKNDDSELKIDLASNDSKSNQKTSSDPPKTPVMINKEIPFSINYTDMIIRTPSHSDNLSKSRCSATCGVNANPDKDNMLSFLSEWRKDQVKKIYMELDRLHSIENYIGNTSHGIEPYMDDKDKEMHVLLAEKMKRAKFKE